MAWVLTKGLTNFRNQANSRWPNRDKARDGTIGDAIHSAGTSGHNPDITGNAEYKDGDSLDEVRAFDMDNNLNESGTTFEMLIQFMIVVLGRQLGILDSVLRYVIYNQRIWRASTGWVTETYTGPSPHTDHGHFSGAYTQAADNDTTFNYRLFEVGNPMDETSIAAANAAKLATDLGNPASGFYINEVKAQQAAYIDLLWKGVHAARNDSAYQAATPADQTTWRNVRDLFRELVGGPVSQAEIISAVAALDQVDEVALAAALASPLAAQLVPAIVAALPASTGGLTSSQVTDAVLAAVSRIGLHVNPA